MPADFSARLNEWGRAAFAHEVQTDFSRARIFDSFFARIELDALREFSKEDLEVLGNILPGLNDESGKTLAEGELHLVDALNQARQRLVMSRRQEMIDESLRLHHSVREQMMKIKKLAQGIFKELAKRWTANFAKRKASCGYSAAWNAGEKFPCRLTCTKKSNSPIASV